MDGHEVAMQLPRNGITNPFMSHSLPAVPPARVVSGWPAWQEL